jgi:Secretion system C-terminal sorting domain
MKKLFFLTCIIIIPMLGISQKYIPFDLSNDEWNCGYSSKGGFFDFYTTNYVKEFVKYYCQGDTLINDTLYKKLYYKGYVQSDMSPAEFPNRRISGYFGAIRNDSVNKRVWLNNSIHYGILYDFNLKIGDPFTYSCSEHDATINSIDSALYCGKYHKRFNYKDAQNINRNIIEGIGSDDGLIPNNCLTSSSYLICFSEKNSACDSCKTPMAIKEIPVDNLIVYPNPTSNSIIISSESMLISIEITDLTGRLIYNNCHVLSNQIQIQLQTNGIYILKVRTQEETYVRKLIKE